MFEGFELRRLDISGVGITFRVGGSGPPLLLLHGYPQTHVLWHKIAERLAEHFTVVASDLRGYGDSDKPSTNKQHQPYSKREMAKDQAGLMRALGFGQFYLAGHDRGGRVGHRLALDHRERVKKLAVLDIAPTHAMYTSADMDFARAYYHWFFLIQPFDLPETLIGANPEYYFRKKLGQWGRDSEAFPDEVMAEYLRCFTPETIHASCEDYRASASIDLEHDQADIDAGRKLGCPVLALWGAKGFVGRRYNVLSEWRNWSSEVTGGPLPCGHYLPEEAPEETLAALLEFLR